MITKEFAKTLKRISKVNTTKVIVIRSIKDNLVLSYLVDWKK